MPVFQWIIMPTLLEQYFHLTVNFYLIPESDRAAASRLLMVLRHDVIAQLSENESEKKDHENNQIPYQSCRS